MSNIVVIRPKEPEDGVIQFLSHIRRKWLLWHEPVLCNDVLDAMKISSENDAECLANYVIGKLGDDVDVYVADSEEIKDMNQNRFFVIERQKNKKVSYYSHDEIKRKGRVARPIPQYVDNIMDADFLKSADMAGHTLTSIRQSTKDQVRARVVYLTVKNDFFIPCILFALKNKQTKRVRYLKGYNIEGKPSDRLYFVDIMEKALKVDIPTAVRIVEDIHQKHKVFVVETHIYDGTDIPPTKFRCKKNRVLSDFKFKRN